MDSYHNHTTFSDGKASVADMVAAAAQAGLGEVGVADHFLIHPEGRAFKWGMPPQRLTEYAAEVRRVARSAGLPVRLGLEADFFPETVDATSRLLAGLELDFIIGSVHFSESFLAVEKRKVRWEDYWGRVAQLAASRAFDLVGHLDLPKKFGHRMEAESPDCALAALDAIAEADMALELNTSGWHHPCQEAYPSLGLLRQACRRGIPILVSADAHAPADVARSFAPARDLAREAGYTQTARFAGRRRSLVRLC